MGVVAGAGDEAAKDARLGDEVALYDGVLGPVSNISRPSKASMTAGQKLIIAFSSGLLAMSLASRM